MVITLIGCLTFSYKVSLSCSGPMLWVFCTNPFQFYTPSQCCWLEDDNYFIFSYEMAVKSTLRSVQLLIELFRAR
jgi:hypothetical protein